MSTPEEPARLVLESSGASAELRRALGAARGDLPSPDHVEAMLARFPFPDGGGGGGGGDTGGGPDAGAGADVAAAAAGAAKSAAVGKWVGIAFLVASAGTVFYAKTTIPPHAVEPTASAVAVASASATPSSAVTAIATTPEPSPIEPSPTESSAPAASANATGALHSQPSASATASASESASSGPVRTETEILKEAAASRSNPARMLELVNEHAKLHPKGMLGQEREMLRIEALVGLGKRAEAKALADAFRKANPSSAYAERLNQIVPP